jgi:hypothetical protein
VIITADPKSDQWNADDFVQGPRTFTIAGVTNGKAEQKYDIALEGTDRAWRPPLTVLRLLLAAWGDDATQWVGHQVTLFRDPEVTFGPNKTGGIRVSHMSHIDGPITETLTVTRGKRGRFTVQPLTARDWVAELDLAGDNLEAVTALGSAARAAKVAPATLALIRARYDELKATER